MYMNKIAHIKVLVELLNHYRDQYYNHQMSEISDFEYDKLFDELSDLERETKFVMTSSPTQTIGYEVKSELTKVTHNHPMLSLDKTKNIDDLVKFFGNQNGVIMAKMDGLTCSLRYIDGELVSAETRGDGVTGEDILHCAKTIKNIPLKINYPHEVVVDGEVIITYDDFEKINEMLPEDQKYKHPRNLASGSIRQLDSNVAAQRNMKFVAWKFVKGTDDNVFINRLMTLQVMGFDVTPFIYVPHKIYNYDELKGLVEEIVNRSKALKYPIDGCVCGYDDVAYGDSLGATEHHLRSQIAYKFYDELYETKLVDVEWTMGKTGTLTPTAVFQTVNIDGTDVNKASLHNISIIKQLGLTNNCTVRVYKANQIIPQIDSCEYDGNSPIIPPKYCPICGHETEIMQDNESEVLVCKNVDCLGKLLGKLNFFVSKPAMNIDGLSEAILQFLIDKGWVKSFKDIYHLSTHQNEWKSCEGFGPKSVNKLLAAIEASRHVKLENFITSLSIPGVGKSVSKLISETFRGDFDAFIKAFEDGYDWSDLEGVGNVLASNIDNYLSKNQTEVRDLASEFTFVQTQTHVDNTLNGLRFCITGSFTQSRDALKAKLESKGAKFVSGVSKNLDVLFCGDNAGSKLTKAQTLGVQIADEKQLLAMLGE